jgi:hypothetical protein
MVKDGFEGIARDLTELVAAGPFGWLVLAGLVLLAVFGVALVWAGSRLALASLAIFVGVLAMWFLYYATGWWSNPGLAGAVPPAFALMIAWLLLVVAAWRLQRRRAATPPGP